MRCEKAHKQNDTEELDKIYDFAEWSLNHKSPDLSNAAGVSFYEHLVDHPITARSIPRFIKPHVFEDVAGLLEWRLGERKFKKLRAEFEKHHKDEQ